VPEVGGRAISQTSKNGRERCRVCGGDSRFSFQGPLLSRQVAYFDCSICGALQTEFPTWLDEAYAAPINATDTGIAARNQLNTARVGALCYLLGNSRARVVDFAGGHGLLVRMLRDAGINAVWSDKYCENLFARGFEHDGGPADIATAFEAFEHFVEPMRELARVLAVAPVVLFSTELLPEPVPPPGQWWYYGVEHGQHVMLYRRRTLAHMAAACGAVLYSKGTGRHAIVRGGQRVDFNKLSVALRAWPFIRRRSFRSLTLADHESLKARLLAGEKL